MARKIEVDPAKLESTATKIDQQALDYEKQYQLLFKTVGDMGTAWQGADNLAFVNQIQGFEEDFKQMKALMEQFSQFLKDSAKLYKNTQSDIINKAKRLAN